MARFNYDSYDFYDEGNTAPLKFPYERTASYPEEAKRRGVKQAYCYHIVNGVVHPRKLKDCPMCAHIVAYRAKQREDKLKEENASQALVVVTTPKTSRKSSTKSIRQCVQCTATISRKNKSGLCIDCFRQQQRDASAARRGTCACGTKLSKNNQSGLCSSCYTKHQAANKKHKLVVYCATEGCNRKLDESNSSGICIDCWRKGYAKERFRLAKAIHEGKAGENKKIL